MHEGGADTAGTPPERFIRNPQDFYAGLTIIAISLFVFWATRNLDGMTGFRFGPGTAPRLISGLFGATGIILLVSSLMIAGPNVGRFSIRGSFFVVGAVLFFAATVGPTGIVVSGFFTIIIASAGSPDYRPKESILVAAALSAFCAILFAGLLDLPLPLWPKL